MNSAFHRWVARQQAIAFFGVSLVLSIGIVVASGCGGNSETQTDHTTPEPLRNGSASFSVQWPAPESARLIPSMAKSIVITITKSDGTTLAEQKMVRPAGGGLTSVTFADLPIGAVIAKASAYPNVDGTGITQASASASVSIEGGKTATLSLTLVSAIDRLEVSPSSLTLVSGASAILQVVPKNSNGVIVLTDAANLAFSSSSSSIVTVDSAGKVTAGAAGDAEVTVSETESGKTASVSVRVTAPSPSPSPSTGGLNVDVK